MVVSPPARTAEPFKSPIAVGTLLSWMLSRTREPAREPSVAFELRMKMGVSFTTASIIASEPTVFAYILWAKYVKG
jgi:hypothetical protein